MSLGGNVEEKLLKVNDVAEKLDVTPQQVRNLIKRKVLKGTRAFGDWRISPQSLREVIKKSME